MRRYIALRDSPSACAAAVALPACRRNAVRIRARSASSRLISSSAGGPCSAAPRRRSALPTILTTREQHGPLHDIAQLAHVARPGILRKRADRLRIEAAQRASVAARRIRKGRPRQRQDIRRSLAQGRHLNFHRVDAKHQVLAELACCNALPEVRIGRRDQAHVHTPRTRGADRLELARSPARATALPAGRPGGFPTSSRNNVPPSASSKRPVRSWRCVGKRAFGGDRTSHFRTHRPATHRYSLSINERSRRPDQLHGPILPNRLLPVPFSPVMRTGAFESATRRATARTLPASPEIRRSRRLLRHLATGRSQPPGVGCA